MLPNPGRGPDGPPRKRAAGQLPFLTNDMLTKQPKEAKILMVKNDPENKFGPSIVLKLALEGNTVLWTVRLKNPNFQELIRKFGTDENDWPGQKILLNLVQDEFSEQWFNNVTFPAETKKSK